MSKVFEYFKILGNLKQVERAGWVRCKVKNPESVAEHMYRMAMMSWALPGNTDLDRDKCMKMALVHDMAESLVGDITPMCGISKDKKQEMEITATAKICDMVGDEEVGKEMYNLWMEYETQSTPEAKFVKDLDKFEMLVQAFEYEQRDNKPGSLQEFYDYATKGIPTLARHKFSSPLVKGWCEELIEKRAKAQIKQDCPLEDSVIVGGSPIRLEKPETSSVEKEGVDPGQTEIKKPLVFPVIETLPLKGHLK